MSTSKIEAIESMPRPVDIAGVRTFGGLINYYKNHISNRSTILQPLYVLLQKGAKFEWSNQQPTDFERAKLATKEDIMLMNLDPTMELRLAPDAPEYGLGSFVA
ncbi:Transposon Ty3-I Gag-Pol polyprotein [Thelohanellus kitauei]|uniref:Transposon Ty3-I Gag-Pol polyprotein n=1 Tax=Thelohanellus kitauei TaxID=669202 RepID=A0A0C2MJX5_THEKT|nr:Transposon Ty3-I Gag-Pol polyprotein [Thelohanellus kitauei]